MTMKFTTAPPGCAMLTRLRRVIPATAAVHGSKNQLHDRLSESCGGIVLQQRIPPTPGLHTNPTWGTISLDYGLSRDVEIAATNLMITDFKPSYGGSFKYRFLHESRTQPAAAAGFVFTGFGDND